MLVMGWWWDGSDGVVLVVVAVLRVGLDLDQQNYTL